MDYNSKSGNKTFDTRDFKDDKVLSGGDEDEFSIPSFTPEDIKDLLSLNSSPWNDQSVGSLEREDKNSNPNTHSLVCSEPNFVKRTYEPAKTYTFVPSVLKTKQGIKDLVRERNIVHKKPDAEFTRRVEYRENFQKYIHETSNKERESEFTNYFVDNLETKKEDSAVFEKKVYFLDGQSEESEETNIDISTNLDNFAEENAKMSGNNKLLVPGKSDVENSDLSQMSQGERLTAKVENKHQSKRYSDKLSHRRDGRSRSPRRDSCSPIRKKHEQINIKAHKWQENDVENKQQFDRFNDKSKYSSSLDPRDRDSRRSRYRYDDKSKYSKTWGIEKDRKNTPSTNKYNRSKETRNKNVERDRENRHSPETFDDRSLTNMNVKSLARDNKQSIDKIIEGGSSTHVSESTATIQNKTPEINKEHILLLDKFDDNSLNVKCTNQEKDGENIANVCIKNDDKLKIIGIDKDDEIRLSIDKLGDKTMNLNDEGLESNRENRRSLGEESMNSKRKEQGESRRSFGSYDDNSTAFKRKDTDRYRYSSKRNKRSLSRSLSPKKYLPRRKKRTRSSSRSSSSSYSSFSSSSSERKSLRKHRRRRRSLSRSPVNRLDKQWLQSIGLHMPEEFSPHVRTFHSDINPATSVIDAPEDEVRKLQTQRYKFIDEETDLRRELNFLSEQRKQLLKTNITDDNPIIMDNSRQQIQLENKVKFIHETVNLLTRRISTLNYLTSKISVSKAKSNVGFTNTRIETEPNTTIPYGMNREVSLPGYGNDHHGQFIPEHPPNNQFHLNKPLQHHVQPNPMDGIPQHSQFHPTQYITDQSHPGPGYSSRHPQTTNPQCIPYQHGLNNPLDRISQPLPINVNYGHLGPIHNVDSSQQLQMTDQPRRQLTQLNLQPSPLEQLPISVAHIGRHHDPQPTNPSGMPLQSVSQRGSTLIEINEHVTKSPLNTVGKAQQFGMSNPKGLSPQSDLPKPVHGISQSGSNLKPNVSKYTQEKNILDEIFDEWSESLAKKAKSDETIKEVINLSDNSCDSTSHQSSNKKTPVTLGEEPQPPVEKSSFNSFAFKLSNSTRDTVSSSSIFFGNKTSTTAAMSATQKRSLMEQRNTFIHKRKVLLRELDFLTEQRKLMTKENLPLSDPFLKTNEEKQVEIQEKLKTIQIVLNNLTTSIGDDELPSKVHSINFEKETSVFKKVQNEDKLRTLGNLSSVVEDSTTATASTALTPPNEENLTKTLNEESKNCKTNVWSDEDTWKPSDKSDSRENNQEEHPSKSSDKPIENCSESEKNEEKLPFYLNQGGPLKLKSMSATNDSIHREESTQRVTNKPQFNYVYYDPEMHWCRVCNVFPKTAKAYLNHLHSDEHKDFILQKKLIDLPWHENESSPEKAEHVPGAPIKRVPIKGLQFFVSATAWYCKICSTWIGDLHCASIHLKSSLHSEKYAIFIQENPEWEMEWLIERTRAFEYSTKKQFQVKDEAPVKDLQVGGTITHDPLKHEKTTTDAKETSTMSKNIEAPLKTSMTNLPVSQKVNKNEASRGRLGVEVSDTIKQSNDNISTEFPEVEKGKYKKKSSEIIDSAFKEAKNRLPIDDLPIAEDDKPTKTVGRNTVSEIEQYKLKSKEILEAKECPSSSESDDDMNVKILAALKEIKKLKMLSESGKPSSPSSDKLISVLKEIRETSSKTAIKSNKSSLASSDSDATFSKRLISITKNLKNKSPKEMPQVKKRNKSSSNESSSSDDDLEDSVRGALRNSHHSSLKHTINKGNPKSLPEKDQTTQENTCIIPEQVESEYKGKKDTFKEDLLNNMLELQKRKDILKKIKNEDNHERTIHSEHEYVKLDGVQNKRYKDEADKSKEDKKGNDKNVTEESKYSSKGSSAKSKYSNSERRSYMDSRSGSSRYRSENQSSRIDRRPDSSSSRRSNIYDLGGSSRYPVWTNDKNRKRSRKCSEGKDMMISDDVKLELCSTAISNTTNLEVKKLEEKLENLTEAEDTELDLESGGKKALEISPTENVLKNIPLPPLFGKIGPIKFSLKNKNPLKISKPNTVLKQSVFDAENMNSSGSSNSDKPSTSNASSITSKPQLKQSSSGILTPDNTS